MPTYDYIDKVSKGNETRKIKDSEAQRISNLVSAFQATPDDTHYPSEKLVNDQLDTKAPKTTTVNGKPLSGNVTLTAEDISYEDGQSEHTSGSVGKELSSLKESIDDIEPYAKNAYELKTITDVPIASFDDGADDVPVKKLVVDIEPVQKGTGDPSPDNVRPITGWTGANVYRSGADTSNPTTYPITFPTEAGTVYGGTLDVTNGALTVDHNVVDGGTLSWSHWYNQYFYASISGKINGTITDIKSDIYTTTNGAPADGIYGIFNTSSPSLAYIADPSLSRDDSGAAALKTKLSGHQIWYSLATPITYTLTPTEVATLLGTNNIWADTGDSTVTYRADPTISGKAKELVIKVLIAPVLTEMVADTALVANDFRIVGDTLYKVTAPIASGGTLTVGTNVVATTIGEQITALLA